MFPAAIAVIAALTHPVGLIALIAVLSMLALFGTVAGPITGFGVTTPQIIEQILNLAGVVFGSYAAGVTAGTIPAGVITGANTCYLLSAATTPGNQTTRTATQLLQDLANAIGIPVNQIGVGFCWEVIITQTGAGTFTLVGGTGVTTSGTMTIAQNASRTLVFQVTATGNSPAITVTSVATGTGA